MTNEMRVALRVLSVPLGLFAAGTYAFYAFGALGGGHGTWIFMIPILPNGLGLLVFPLGFLLASDFRGIVSRVLFLILMTLHFGHLSYNLLS